MSNKSIDLKYLINRDLLDWYQEISNAFFLIIDDKGEIIYFSEDSLNFFSIKSVYELEESLILKFIGKDNWNILEDQLIDSPEKFEFFNLPKPINDKILSIKWKYFKDEGGLKYFILFQITQPKKSYDDYYKKALDNLNIPIVIIKDNQFHYTNQSFKELDIYKRIQDYHSFMNWLKTADNEDIILNNDIIFELKKNDLSYEITNKVLIQDEKLFMISITKKVKELDTTTITLINKNTDKISADEDIKLNNITDQIINIKLEIENFYEETQNNYNSLTTEVINNIKEQYTNYKDIVTYTSDNLLKMSENSSFIDELSIKIHLISINSAIESARLGEKGKGFAIISHEIAKISEETNNYVKSIENQIKDIRDYTRKIYITETDITNRQVIDQTTDLQEKLKSIISNFRNLIINKINRLLEEIKKPNYLNNS